jgi:pyridinium-3,5-bisthiocarboxylic acid mononucleotide nickel chelatase
MTPQRHIRLQPLGGIAGDMFVAAMLDAFPDFAERVLADVSAVLPREAGEARLARVSKNGIAALQFSLAGASPAPHPSAAPRAAADGAGAHSPTAHHHGTYKALRSMIDAARLSGTAAAHALGILRVLAEAEAAIHGVPVDEVHFHEIADWDSLMDVVAAGSVISAVGEATWSVDALPLGGGQVRTQHGWLPVPAPATASILEGYAWRSDGIEGERVTPTGAAIIRHLIAPGAAQLAPGGTLAASGYGAGTKHFPALANVLRVMAFDAPPATETSRDAVASVQFDIDDMTGEEIGVAAERLRGVAGVLDLALVAAQGKKGRPVTMFHLLAEADALHRCCDAIFAQTSTIGLRWTLCERRILPRSVREPGEGLRVKEVRRPDGRLTRKVESDDLQAFQGLQDRRATKTQYEDPR